METVGLVGGGGGGGIADEILSNPSEVGYLPISNALQWRLQYGRVIEKTGLVTGVERLA